VSLKSPLLDLQKGREKSGVLRAHYKLLQDAKESCLSNVLASCFSLEFPNP
jgi:hypothetical protein